MEKEIQEQIKFVREVIEKRKDNRMADAFISGYLLDLIEQLSRVIEEIKKEGK
jgi:hypothetical protein